MFYISSIFISIIGTILHFTYKWSNKNKFVAIFSAVNESTWEHIKMALSGSFLWSIIDCIYYGDMTNYFFAKLVSLLIIIILIPLIFYGYNLFTKKQILFIDILSFYATIFLSQFIFYKILNAYPISNTLNVVSIILTVIIFLFYLLASFFPPKIFLFKDPITNTYGVYKEK